MRRTTPIIPPFGGIASIEFGVTMINPIWSPELQSTIDQIICAFEQIGIATCAASDSFVAWWNALSLKEKQAWGWQPPPKIHHRPRRNHPQRRRH